jgi:hypothetical protein
MAYRLRYFPVLVGLTLAGCSSGSAETQSAASESAPGDRETAPPTSESDVVGDTDDGVSASDTSGPSDQADDESVVGSVGVEGEQDSDESNETGPVDLPASSGEPPGGDLEPDEAPGAGSAEQPSDPPVDEMAPSEPGEVAPEPDGSPPDRLPPEEQPLEPKPDPDACQPEDCPDNQVLISAVCSDGTASPATCQLNDEGMCAWQITPCIEILPGPGPAGDTQPSPEELECGTDADCTACALGPVSEGDCACSLCPSHPVNVAACRARQAAVQKCSAVISCPQVLCIEPPLVQCVSGQCEVTGEGGALR